MLATLPKNVDQKLWTTLLKMLRTLPKNVDEKMLATFLKNVDEKYWQQFQKII
jgi:hypothetical protein